MDDKDKDRAIVAAISRTEADMNAALREAAEAGISADVEVVTVITARASNCRSIRVKAWRRTDLLA